MLVRFSRKQNRTEHHLVDQLFGHVPRESHVHTRIDQRFHYQEDVGWTSGAQRSRHVDLSLVLDANSFTERLEHRAYLSLLFFSHAGTGSPGSDAFADL